MRAATARPPPHARRAAGERRADDHARGPRRTGGAAPLRRRAGAGLPVGRPPPLPVVRAGGADRGVDPVRPRRRGVEHLRRLVAGGVGRRLRRERGAALGGRPGRTAGDGRRGVRERRHGRQPERPARRPVAVAERGRRALDRTRGLVLASGGAHSSVAQAARAMDADVIRVPADERGRLTRRGAATRPSPALATTIAGRLFAVVATCGTTNAGVVDDLAAAADASSDARRVAPRRRRLRRRRAARAGGAPPVRRHRALRQLHRRPAQVAVRPVRLLRARCTAIPSRPRRPTPSTPSTSTCCTTSTSRQRHAAWNPSDYAHHLSRRARGLPFWFSLATYGTDAYGEAVETTLRVTREAPT